MKLAFTYGGHHGAGLEWERRELHDWLTDIFEAPAITIQPKCTQLIREHVMTECLHDSWAMNAKIDLDLNLTVFALKDDMAFQLQTGNMSRAPYDLLKLQYLFQSSKIEIAALALPSNKAARQMGGNLANAERVCNELKFFDRIITVPILVVAFE